MHHHVSDEMEISGHRHRHKAPWILYIVSRLTDDTHDACVTGADVGLCLRPRLPDTEVVCLLLELGEVEGPGLLPAEVPLARGLGGQPQLPPPPEGAAEHRRRVILELINNFIKVNEKKTVGSFVAFFVGTSVT